MVARVCLIAALAAASVSCSSHADAKGRHSLIEQHQCVSMRKPLQPPVAGYLIRDTAQPRRGLFYESVDALTAGRFEGMGGTWRMIYWCKR